MVCKGTDLNPEERMASESSGESEVSLDDGVDPAQAVVWTAGFARLLVVGSMVTQTA